MKTYTVELLRTKEGLRINGQLCKIVKGHEVTIIENYSVGIGYSAHANIASSGSVKGMKKLGYWRKEDRTVRFNGFIYNMNSLVISDPIDALAYYIECGGGIPDFPIKHETEKPELYTFSINQSK